LIQSTSEGILKIGHQLLCVKIVLAYNTFPSPLCILPNLTNVHVALLPTHVLMNMNEWLHVH